MTLSACKQCRPGSGISASCDKPRMSRSSNSMSVLRLLKSMLTVRVQCALLLPKQKSPGLRRTENQKEKLANGFGFRFRIRGFEKFNSSSLEYASWSKGGLRKQHGLHVILLTSCSKSSVHLMCHVTQTEAKQQNEQTNINSSFYRDRNPIGNQRSR